MNEAKKEAAQRMKARIAELSDSVLLTTVEAAAFAGVTTQTVTNWIKSGKIVADKEKKGLAYIYRIKKSNLLKLLSDC